MPLTVNGARVAAVNPAAAVMARLICPIKRWLRRKMFMLYLQDALRLGALRDDDLSLPRFSPVPPIHPNKGEVRPDCPSHTDYGRSAFGVSGGSFRRRVHSNSSL